MPIINVDDMMGFFPQQTVFVATTDHVTAVTLLNHFTRYEITTEGIAQVSAESSGQLLYLLDLDTPGMYRLRAFDIATGSQRAVRDGIADLAADRRVLSTTSDSRVLVLKSDPRHAWVDAYDALDLRPLGLAMEKQGCGDRLLTSAVRVAIVCLATGAIAVDDLHGNQASIDGVLPDLVAAAVADDGTLYVATADQHLAVVAPDMTKLLSVPWPSEWSGTVLADGLAAAIGGPYTVIAERSGDAAWLRVFETNNIAHRRSLRLAGAPQGGVVIMWPFGYYTMSGALRHVDLNSGLLETMSEVGEGAIPGAVVNG
jgi:hypothetical protein